MPDLAIQSPRSRRHHFLTISSKRRTTSGPSIGRRARRDKPT